MNSPHPGLVAAIALAGSRRKLAKIIGKEHNYVGYRFRTGKGLPEREAIIAGQKLGLRASTMMDKESK